MLDGVGGAHPLAWPPDLGALRAAVDLVEYLLFVYEAPLTGAVIVTTPRSTSDGAKLPAPRFSVFPAFSTEPRTSVNGPNHGKRIRWILPAY